MHIYLDHNSTTPIDGQVADVIRGCYAAGYVNPASQHRPGQTARQALEQFRWSIADQLGANMSGMATDQLIFTSGGTESNNLALIGLAMLARQRGNTEVPPPEEYEPNGKSSGGASGQILISSIEHPSIVGAAGQLAKLGFSVHTIPVDKQGICQIDALEEMLHRPTLLVSIMLANNETGVLQPVAEAVKLCRQHGILFHTDAVQAVGKLPVDFRQLGVDSMTFTAHKFNGPRGIGGLIVKNGVSLQPQLFGGFQQMGIRPGTEDVALVAGMDAALKLFTDHPQRMAPVIQLRDQLQTFLTSNLTDTIVIGGDSPRTPSTLNIAFRGIDRQSFLLAADMNGMAISTGSACASGSSELSPVLLAMKLPKDVIEGAIRISLGVSNTPAEIEETGRRIIKIVNNLRQ